MEVRKEKTERKIRILAVKDGRIVGQISLMSPLHIEGVYIEPEHRGNGVLKKLVNEAELEAKTMNVDKVLAFAVNEQMEDYIERLGYKRLSMSVWMRDLDA